MREHWCVEMEIAPKLDRAVMRQRDAVTLQQNVTLTVRHARLAHQLEWAVGTIFIPAVERRLFATQKLSHANIAH